MNPDPSPTPQYTPSPDFAALREMHRLRQAHKDLTERDVWLLVLDELRGLRADLRAKP